MFRSDMYTHCARCATQLHPERDTGAYCANCTLEKQDKDAVTLDVAGVIRQLAGLPPHMEVIARSEYDSLFYLRPGSGYSGTDPDHPAFYAFRVAYI